MKIILSDSWEKLHVRIFDGENKEEIVKSFKSLPKQKYEMEMFEMKDHTGIVLSFDDDLHIKIANEDREKFESCFKIATHDHVFVDFGEIL